MSPRPTKLFLLTLLSLTLLLTSTTNAVPISQGSDSAPDILARVPATELEGKGVNLVLKSVPFVRRRTNVSRIWVSTQVV